MTENDDHRSPTNAEYEAEVREVAMTIDPTGHLYREGQRIGKFIAAMDENLDNELVNVDGAVEALASENQMLVFLDGSIRVDAPLLDPVRDWIQERDMELVEKVVVPALGSMTLLMTVFRYQARHLLDAIDPEVAAR
jgi:hypothetical protein